MLTIPGLSTLREPSPTVVRCPCGAPLMELAPGEAVYPSGTLLRTMGQTTNRQVGCDQCGAESTFPITTHPHRSP